MNTRVAAIAIVAAVLPAWLLLHYFRRFDVFPEPDHVVARTFYLGCFAVVPVGAVLVALEPLFESIETPLAYALITATLRSAVPEELAKFSILQLYCRRHSAFDEPMDGLVYGATASLGFAAMENVLFVIGAGDGWIEVAVMRALLTVPSHALGGVIMGFFISRAHFEPERRERDLALALAVPTALHAGFNMPLFYVEAAEITAADGVAVTLPLITVGIVVAEAIWAHRLFFRLRSLQREEQARQRAAAAAGM